MLTKDMFHIEARYTQHAECSPRVSAGTLQKNIQTLHVTSTDAQSSEGHYTTAYTVYSFGSKLTSTRPVQVTPYLPQKCRVLIYRPNYPTQLNNRMLLTLRRLMSYIYGAPILDVSRSHTTTQHSG